MVAPSPTPPPRRSSRTPRAPQRYSPEETPVDDYSDSEYDSDYEASLSSNDSERSEDSTSGDESFIDDTIVYEPGAEPEVEEPELGDSDMETEEDTEVPELTSEESDDDLVD